MKNPHPRYFVLWLAYLFWRWWLKPPLKRLWWLNQVANPLVLIARNLEEAYREEEAYKADRFSQNEVAQAYQEYRNAQKSADKAVRNVNKARREERYWYG